MGRIRYYTDEHVSNAVAAGLRRRGIDVLTTYEADILGASDKEHLVFAARHGMIVFTQDADFLRLHAAGVDHTGIVYARQHTPIGEVVRGLFLLHQVVDADEMRGAIRFL